MVSWAIALHGGAGMIAKENMTSDWKKRTEAALNEILNIGVVALENNLSAVETVELVVSTNSNLHFTFSTCLHSLASYLCQARYVVPQLHWNSQILKSKRYKLARIYSSWRSGS